MSDRVYLATSRARRSTISRMLAKSLDARCQLIEDRADRPEKFLDRVRVDAVEVRPSHGIVVLAGATIGEAARLNFAAAWMAARLGVDHVTVLHEAGRALAGVPARLAMSEMDEGGLWMEALLRDMRESDLHVLTEWLVS